MQQQPRQAWSRTAPLERERRSAPEPAWLDIRGCSFSYPGSNLILDKDPESVESTRSLAMTLAPRLRHFIKRSRSHLIVVWRPIALIAVVSGISLGQTSTQFCALPQS